MLMKKKEKNKRNEFSFVEHFDIIKKEISLLFQKNSLAKDVKYLRKMAINIKQLHHDAKNAQSCAHLKVHAKAVEGILSKPIEALGLGKMALTQAADSFSEQHPGESDLSQLLSNKAAVKLLRACLKLKAQT
jgi:hypothetical protein